ncbi:MAG: DUF853 family protein [Lewinellaceae bacterium]|nr:DUF853 family protein [Lewinellaceae bacterium]
MTSKDKFVQTMSEGYTFKGECMVLGGAMIDGECQTNTLVKAPLRMFNRHGLISGATGTGKTKTLQVIAEQLSGAGVPTLLMDVKGDLSGIAMTSPGHPKIDERHQKIGIPYTPGGNPVEFLSLSEEKGVRLRATVTEFGPVLFSRMLNLSDAQSGVLAIIFKYCDDNEIPLVDLEDLRKVIQYVTDLGKEEISREYGSISTSSAGSILRKVVELEQQGASRFFGEPSFEVDDLCRIDDRGRGIISILRLTDIQDRPKLFSTFMIQMLAEVYANFPEEGDLEKPKLVLFIDEAHLVFEEASKALLDQIEIIMKLIRSKGIGIFFVTQNPADIPDAVLGQLGMKVQHALRAFTARDRKAIKLAAENFPISDFYPVDELLTQLGTGEALVTVLNDKGIPTPLVQTLLRAPQSRMDVLTDSELEGIVSRSPLVPRYNKVVDRESAKEILQRKMDFAVEAEEQETRRQDLEKARKEASRTTTTSSGRTSTRKQKSVFDELVNSPTTRQIGRTFARELTRGLLSVLGVSSSRSRTRTRKK